MELNTVVPNAGSKNKVHDPLLYGNTPYLMGFSATAVYTVLNITFFGTWYHMRDGKSIFRLYKCTPSKYI